MKNKILEYVTINIEQDNSAGNPRDEFDHLSTFYGPRNTRYITGGQKDIETDARALPSLMNEYRKMGAVIVPFTSNAGDCFAVVDCDDIVKGWVKNGYTLRSALYHARQCAKGEIEEFLNWANGEVYGYIITDNETGETLDSCWGFYGREYCEEEAQSMAESLDKELAEKARQVSDRLEMVTD